MSLVAIAAVLSTLHLEGSATPAGGDYIDVPFTVPAGTVEFSIARTYDTTYAILDFGVWAPEGYRGWSGGLTDDIVIGVDQSSRGYLPGAITPGAWTVAIGKAQLAPDGVAYAIDITFNDAATIPVLAKADYTPVVMATDHRWYKGDFHVHSTQSGDAHASLDDDIALAASRGLDFANLSDHNTIAQHALIAAAQASWPVLALRGSEITTYSGHGNGVGLVDYVDHRLGHNGRTIGDVIDDVTAQGALFIVNHPATNLGTNCIGCAWMHDDDTPWNEVSGIEVLTSGYDVGVEAFTPTVLALWDAQEDAGNRIAAVTGSDDHSAGLNEGATGAPIGSPCTQVLADELSEAGIIAAVRARHTKAQLRGPDDPDVDFTMTAADGSEADIGDDAGQLSAAHVTVHVATGDGMFVQLWRDGAKVTQTAVAGDDFSWTYADTAAAGAHRWRIELVDDTNRRVVITSHIYAQLVASGGGCNAGGGGGGWGLGLAIGLLIRRRARRGSR